MRGSAGVVVLEPLAVFFQWFCFNQIDRLEHLILFTSFSLFHPPPAFFSSPSCHPIAPPVPFPPQRRLLFSPHQMVPKKEPLSRLVLPRSYLLIGKPRGENNGYWLPHWVKLLGRTSGGVRKDGILHPPLPRCCQNSLRGHSTYPVPFHPSSLPSPDLLSWIAKVALPLLFLAVLCRFLSVLVKCIAERSSSSRPRTEAPAFHTLPELRCLPSPFAFTQPIRSQVKSLALDLVSSFHVVFLCIF